MARLDPAYPIAGLRGAEYNPRRIDDEAREQLRHSLGVLGVCKPIIVSGDLIIAGHQRTQALRALGVGTAPVVVLGAVSPEDEIRFNQLHNGTDFDSGDEGARAGAGVPEGAGFEMVPVSALSGDMRASMANVRTEIAKLLRRYGNWGACVATASGEVLHAAQYVLACMALDWPARVYRIPDALRDEAVHLLGRKYGVFSYDHLERKTYIQTFAQLTRLRDGKAGIAASAKSTLYERRVLPALRPGQRLLDFGCGQADYVKKLQAAGHRVLGIEFFFRSGNKIDASAVHRMIDAAAGDLERNGLFDAVVVDSVLNSVDSLQAEADVLACANAFCRPGGMVYFSGRRLEHIEGQDRARQNSRHLLRYIEFLDEHGFSALFRNGNWFYQKFHDQAQAEGLAAAWIGEGAAYVSRGTSWSIAVPKTVELAEEVARAAIAREFDLI